jgi:hypothetical protein
LLDNQNFGGQEGGQQPGSVWMHYKQTLVFLCKIQGLCACAMIAFKPVLPFMTLMGNQLSIHLRGRMMTCESMTPEQGCWVGMSRNNLSQWTPVPLSFLTSKSRVMISY